MIHEVDEALKALIQRDALNGVKVEVVLDAPTKDWASRRNAPTINVYLYDIREDTERREVQYEEIRDSAGRIIERRPPPRRFRLSYIVSAWTQRAEDEHRLLSALLGCFLKQETIPKDLLVGSLAAQPLPVRVSVSLPVAQNQMSVNDAWARLGGDFHPAIDLFVTAPFDPARVEKAGPPVLEEPRMRVLGPGTPSESPPPGKGRDLTAVEISHAVPEESVDAGTTKQRGRRLRVRGATR